MRAVLQVIALTTSVREALHATGLDVLRGRLEYSGHAVEVEAGPVLVVYRADGSAWVLDGPRRHDYIAALFRDDPAPEEPDADAWPTTLDEHLTAQQVCDLIHGATTPTYLKGA